MVQRQIDRMLLRVSHPSVVPRFTSVEEADVGWSRLAHVRPFLSFFCTHHRPGQSDADDSERRENGSNSPGEAERHGRALDSWTSRPPRNTMRNMCTRVRDKMGTCVSIVFSPIEPTLISWQTYSLHGILLESKKKRTYNSLEQKRTICALRCWLNCQMASIEALLSLRNKNSTIPRRRGTRPLFVSCHVSLPHSKQDQFPRMVASNLTTKALVKDCCSHVPVHVLAPRKGRDAHPGETTVPSRQSLW